jgi:hypothetical protein
MTRDGALDACLVLDARRAPLRIGLVGRALMVEAPGRARVLHPIGRLDRVAIIGDALVETAALRALGDAARPCGLMDGEGRLRSVLVPLGRRRTTLGEALDRLQKRPDWAGRLEDWRRARLSRLARGLVPDPASAARAGWAGAEALLCAAIPASRARRARLAAEARSHASLAALASLGAAGIPARWTGTAGDPACNLVPIFGQVALWHLVRRLLRAPGPRQALAEAYAADGRCGAPGAGMATARLMAAAEQPLRRALRNDLRMFHAWLLDLTMGIGSPEADGMEWAG